MALKAHDRQINKDSIWVRDLRFQFKAFLILLSRFSEADSAATSLDAS